MVCFFGKSRAFLPSPMVSTNTWGSNRGPVLGAGGGRVRFRVRRDFCSLGVGTTVFVEPLDSRGEAMSTPPLIPRSNTLYPSCPGPSCPGPHYWEYRGRFSAFIPLTNPPKTSAIIVILSGG